MPLFHYAFHHPAGCPAGTPAASLTVAGNRLNVSVPQMVNAQLMLGVYPAGWAVDEMNWRIHSLIITFAQAAGLVLPIAPPALAGGAVGIGAGIGFLGAANLPPSPVALGVDSTEKGQLGYHVGTAVGGTLGYRMATGHANALWFAFHLSRAITMGAGFTFHTAERPDIVTFSVDPGTATWYHFVVWENKGHCQAHAVGGAAAIAPALQQAQSLNLITALPAAPAIAVAHGFGAVLGALPLAPDAYVASMVDVFHGNFRAQVVDPSRPPRKPIVLATGEMDGFLRAFYAPFVEATRRSSATRVYDGVSFRTVLLAKDVRLGLDTRIYDALIGGGGGGTLSGVVGRATAAGYKNASNPNVFVDRTGVSVELPQQGIEESRGG